MLANHGVLFLDELCEFSRTHLEALRQPLESGAVSIVRARGAVTYPARFLLLGAANPCPCGHLGDERGCRCAPRQLQQYRSRLSGPIRDRVDLTVAVPRQQFDQLVNAAGEEPSAAVRDRVAEARERRRRRPDPRGERTVNGLLDACRTTPGARRMLARAGEQLRLSARGFVRVARVARTIADLAAEDAVAEPAVAEALHFRHEVTG
jgi:magnesium chelatase family protein